LKVKTTLYVIVNGKPEIETLVINTATSVEFYI